MKHMTDNGLFTNHQHGFLPGRSCITQLLEVLDNWLLNYDDNTGIDAIYLDFSKAFDSVPHTRLLSQLHSYGITGNVHRWVSQFLRNRKQCVSLNDADSTWTDVISRIPQGSVLGPVLFVIYINNLPDEVKTNVKMFADDTKIWTPINNKDDCDKLQDDLLALQNWANKWQLRFNAQKCKVLRIGNNLPTYSYSMDDPSGQTRSLEETTCEKDLGVFIIGRAHV